MNLHIINAEHADPVMLSACMNKALGWGGAENVTILVSRRRPDGWLEYSIDIHGDGHRRLIFIAAIQRQVDAEIEFCS